MATELTAVEAFGLLREGNRRFVTGAPQHPRQGIDRRTELVAGQNPFAVFVGCSDSRPPAEILFDQGLGDLFVVRTAGHVLGAEVLGSIEFGVDVLQCPLVVIMGHESCGAVGAAAAAVDQGQMPTGFVGDLVEHVVPSVLASHAAGRLTMGEMVADHVSRTVDLLLEHSPMLVQRVEAGHVAVVGMTYRLADGATEVVAARGDYRSPQDQLVSD